MRIYKPQTWLLIGTVLGVALVVLSIGMPSAAIAQESGTPTHPPPPPTRTQPPGPRVTPTTTTAPPPTSAPGEQPTASPTPEAPPVMPETGTASPGGMSTLASLALLILGMCLLGWGLMTNRRSSSLN